MENSKKTNLKQKAKNFKEKWLYLIKNLRKTYKKTQIPEQEPYLTPEEKRLKRHLDLATLNTKDDSYMLTSNGKHLVFLTFNDIIKYNIETQKVEIRNTLAPLLFPFLKKMLVRRRDLLINETGDKILGIIEERLGTLIKYCLLIYDIYKNETKVINLKLEEGEKIIEWIVADNWSNEIFFKVEKKIDVKEIPPYGNKRRKMEVIKKFDLRREKSEIFYLCNSMNKIFEKETDDGELKKNDVDIKHVPFFELDWILIYEGLKRDPSVFNLKILDIHNKKILVPLVDFEFKKEDVENLGKMNMGYLHFIGNFRFEKLFLRSDFNFYVLEPKLRSLVTTNSVNYEKNVKKYPEIGVFLSETNIEKIRKLDIRKLDTGNFLILEMYNHKRNTGLVDLYIQDLEKMEKELNLRICYNNNDRKFREIRIYHMTETSIMKLSDTPGCENGDYFTAMNIINLKNQKVEKFCTQISKDPEKYSGIISVKVDWEEHYHVLMVKPKGNSLYKFYVIYHLNRTLETFEIDLKGHRVESDTEFYLKNGNFLIWISKFGVFSYKISSKELKEYKNEVELGKIFGASRSNKKLPCFYKDGEHLIRDGITPPNQGERTKTLSFYNFKTGNLDTVFTEVPNDLYQWNDKHFLYYILFKDNQRIFVYDLEMREKIVINLNILGKDQVSLLRVDRRENSDKDKGEYYVSVCLKIERIIENFMISKGKIIKKWVYRDWIPNIQRVKFKGEMAYVMLSTVSAYILDERKIIKADKRALFEALLERNWEDEEEGFSFVEDVYFSLVGLTEPFAYFLVEFVGARELFDGFCDLEIEGKGKLDKEFFGTFEGI